MIHMIQELFGQTLSSRPPLGVPSSLRILSLSDEAPRALRAYFPRWIFERQKLRSKLVFVPPITLTGYVFGGTNTSVNITFDPEKNAINIAKHGISLARAEDMNMETAVIITDDRFDYGEVRYLCVRRY
jgi:hypothetical protein